MKRFDCVAALRALADEKRLKIMRQVLAGGSTVGGIAESVGLTPYNTSKHLRVLREAGLVQLTVHGRYRRYALADFVPIQPATLDLGCCQLHFQNIPLGTEP